jgi:carbon monoxide dehydrogenase subunit G
VRFLGSAEFVASRDQVWDVLIDPTHFGPCSPAPIRRVDDRHFVATARVGSGLFSTSVRVDLEVTDVVPRDRARITGRGAAAGMQFEGSSSFSVRPGSMDGTTTVDWEVEIRLSGMFAAQATNFIEEHAPDAVEQLLTCIHRQVEG